MNLFVISTLSCILDYVAPIVIKYLTSRIYARRNVDTTLRNDLLKLKQEIAEVSMVDEFSKYAKLQRKHNRLENALKKKVNEQLSLNMKVRMCTTSVFRVLNGILTSTLLYMYSKEPVVILPKGTLWPIQNFLSWPSYQEDCISLAMWLAVARLAVSTCRKVDMS